MFSNAYIILIRCVFGKRFTLYLPLVFNILFQPDVEVSLIGYLKLKKNVSIFKLSEIIFVGFYCFCFSSVFSLNLLNMFFEFTLCFLLVKALDLWMDLIKKTESIWYRHLIGFFRFSIWLLLQRSYWKYLLDKYQF